MPGPYIINLANCKFTLQEKLLLLKYGSTHSKGGDLESETDFVVNHNQCEEWILKEGDRDIDVLLLINSKIETVQ